MEVDVSRISIVWNHRQSSRRYGMLLHKQFTVQLSRRNIQAAVIPVKARSSADRRNHISEIYRKAPMTHDCLAGQFNQRSPLAGIDSQYVISIAKIGDRYKGHEVVLCRPVYFTVGMAHPRL